jgi:regulator of RNase E activity RraA
MEKLIIDDDYYFSHLEPLSTTLLWDRSYGKASIIETKLINFTPNLKLTGPCFLVETRGQILPVIHALHAIPENHVLVINDLCETEDTYHYDALLGDIIAESARLQKLKGIVVFGHVRDVEAIRKLGVPLWAKGISIRAARLGTEIRSFPEELVIDYTKFRKGDWLIGDENGLILIKQESLRVIIKAAEFKNKKEVCCIQRIQSGEKISDQMNMENYLKGEGKIKIEF